MKRIISFLVVLCILFCIFVISTSANEHNTLNDSANDNSVSSDKKILCDVDNNGNVMVNDSTIIQKYMAGLVSLSANELLRADVNFDGVVNIKDVSAIQKYVSGIIDIFV